MEDEGKSNPEMGIGLSFVECATGVKSFIARLPYVAGPGEVKDIFMADVAPGSKAVVIIHSAPIRAFTGVSYGSDYFSVMVFNRENNKFYFDTQLTGYFGSGADVVKHGDVSDTPIYIYPYKTQDSILGRLKSQKYRDWISGASPELSVVRRAIIYSSMTVADPTKMYLIKGDKVTQESVAAGWIYISYKTAQGKKIQGWMLCEDVGGC
jgi:hypothetical protein